MDDIAEALRNTTEDGADPDLIYRAADEIERLRAIEAAARNLCNQKGRHNTEIAMLRLMSVCGY